MRRANILEPIPTTEPDAVRDLHGFHHVGRSLTARLGADQLGASIYSTDSTAPTGPFHYHHGVEEWVYVISGEPILRDHEGERRLQRGDVVAFPVGPAGVHTFRGPGTFIVFSTGTQREPWMSVYPDSGKVSGPEGILLASSKVEYWHGEGTWEPTSADGISLEMRELELLPRSEIVNVDALALVAPSEPSPPAGYRARTARLGERLGAQMLGGSVYELDPGEGTAPYHYHSGREEWLLVLSGAPSVRHPDGEDVLDAGDVVCFVDGPGGAHRVLNRSSEPARLLILSTTEQPVTAHYPDSGKILIRDADGGRFIFRESDAVDYWEGEA